MRTGRALRGASAGAALFLWLAGSASLAEQAQAGSRCAGSGWLGAWATSPAYGEPRAFEDQTLRLVVNPTAGGRLVRVRVSNRFGSSPLRLGGVTIGRRAAGAALVPGSLRRLSFGGRRAATLAAGATAASDPARLRFAAFEDLAVSIHVRRMSPGATTHPFAFQTSFVAGGNRTGDLAPGAFSQTTTSWSLLAGVDVRAPLRAGAVVAFGASSVDGTGSPRDANHRFTDFLARRLQRRRGPRLSVLNAGIAGNRLLLGAENAFGPSLLSRARDDVIRQPGASDVILWLGSGNDFRIPPAPPARAVIRGLKTLIARLQRQGLNVIVATISPSAGSVFPTADGVAAMNAKVHEVNAWIRSSKLPDAVADLAAVLRDRSRPDFLAPRYDSGDGQHPNSAGYRAVARAIDLSTLRGPSCAGRPAA